MFEKQTIRTFPPNRLRDRLALKLQSIVYRLDSIGSAEMEKNGESLFIENFAKSDEDIVVFDIGANLGDYTRLLRSRRNNSHDNFHLFEPQRSCFNLLNEEFGKVPNIHLNNLALSDHAGTSVIYKDSDKSGLTSLYRRNLRYYGLSMEIEEPITLVRADEYIKSHAVSKINLVKMDVEGHEMGVLNGFGDYLDSNFLDYIQFEYGGADLDSRTNLQDFYNLLESRNFAICRIRKNGLEIRPYHPRFENFVTANYVAVSRALLNA